MALLELNPMQKYGIGNIAKSLRRDHTRFTETAQIHRVASSLNRLVFFEPFLNFWFDFNLLVGTDVQRFPDESFADLPLFDKHLAGFDHHARHFEHDFLVFMRCGNRNIGVWARRYEIAYRYHPA